MRVFRFLTLISLIIVTTSSSAEVEDRLPTQNRRAPKKTVQERIAETQPLFEGNLLPLLKKAELTAKPSFVTLLFLKDSKTLMLYAGTEQNTQKWIKSYPVKAASGSIGPKLKEGDKQVPEGIYKVVSLNPNSTFYLSLRLNYPNEYDKKQAQQDKRTQLGSDIMIHGYHSSRGCVAIGDEAISELFYLAATTDISHWKVLLAPTDLRTQAHPQDAIQQRSWVKNLYDQLKKEMLILNENSTSL